MNKLPAAGARPPVSIITGYLGAGKTTLLNRLLAHGHVGENGQDGFLQDDLGAGWMQVVYGQIGHALAAYSQAPENLVSLSLQVLSRRQRLETAAFARAG